MWAQVKNFVYEHTNPDGIMLFKKRNNIRMVNAVVQGLGFSGLVFSIFSELFGLYGMSSWSKSG